MDITTIYSGFKLKILEYTSSTRTAYMKICKDKSYPHICRIKFYG